MGLPGGVIDVPVLNNSIDEKENEICPIHGVSSKGRIEIKRDSSLTLASVNIISTDGNTQDSSTSWGQLRSGMNIIGSVEKLSTLFQPQNPRLSNITEHISDKELKSHDTISEKSQYERMSFPQYNPTYNYSRKSSPKQLTARFSVPQSQSISDQHSTCEQKKISFPYEQPISHQEKRTFVPKREFESHDGMSFSSRIHNRISFVQKINFSNDSQEHPYSGDGKLSDSQQNSSLSYDRVPFSLKHTDFDSICTANYRYERQKRGLSTFYSGARYLGEWNSIGMAGKGVYKYPHGVIYDGNFNNNGQFDGFGTLIYPNGQRLEGVWKKGKLVSEITPGIHGKASLDDSKQPDRRFSTEIMEGFRPPGKELVTKEEEPAKLEPNCFDVGEGIYDANKYLTTSQDFIKKNELSFLNEDENPIYKELDQIPLNPETQKFVDDLKSDPDDTYMLNRHKVAEIPTAEKREWIKKYCRSSINAPVTDEFKSKLFEVYNSGAKSKINEIEKPNLHVHYLNEYPTESTANITIKDTKMFIVEREMRAKQKALKLQRVKPERRKTVRDSKKSEDQPKNPFERIRFVSIAEI